MTAVAATLLALCFALIVTRTRLPGRRLVGVLSVLPMITPPFVIGLALILLFGRSGAVNALLEWAFGIGRRGGSTGCPACGSRRRWR
jgi:iron(III) transport system permease protein